MGYWVGQERKCTSVLLPLDVYQRVLSIAKSRKVPLSYVAREAIDWYLDSYEQPTPRAGLIAPKEKKKTRSNNELFERTNK